MEPHFNALLRAGQHAEALAVAERALAEAGPAAPWHLRAGLAALLAGHPQQARAHYRAAAVLGTLSAGDHYNAGICATACEDDAAAETHFRHALASTPGDARLLGALGRTLHDLGRFADSEAVLRRSLEIEPGRPLSRLHLAASCLIRRRWAEGWAHYEARGAAATDLPAWQGSTDGAGLLLLRAEQGLGDTIMLARFARLLAERGRQVLLQVPRPLLALLGGLQGPRLLHDGQRVVADGIALEACALGSVPRLLGITPESVPFDAGYLSADAARIAAWRARLPQGGLRVGLAWQGNPHSEAERGRSLPLGALAALARVPGVHLVSLQKHAGTERLRSLPHGMRVLDLGEALDPGPDAFLDTAAVIAQLDLVITVDTAIAHLAGALGRPVWILLRRVPDWRWLAEGEGSCWYASARLFRQSVAGDWSHPVDGAARALAVLAGAPVQRCIAAPVSAGDLVDRIGILEIKAARIADPADAGHVRRELDALRLVAAGLPELAAIAALQAELATVNAALWDAEDRVRRHEAAGDFGPDFVATARSIHRMNDRRAALKRAINLATGSALVEAKAHSATGAA